MALAEASTMVLTEPCFPESVSELWPAPAYIPEQASAASCLEQTAELEPAAAAAASCPDWLV